MWLDHVVLMSDLKMTNTAHIKEAVTVEYQQFDINFPGNGRDSLVATNTTPSLRKLPSVISDELLARGRHITVQAPIVYNSAWMRESQRKCQISTEEKMSGKLNCR